MYGDFATLHLLNCFWCNYVNSSGVLKSENGSRLHKPSMIRIRSKPRQQIHWNFSWVIATFIFSWRCLRMFFPYFCSTYPPILSKSPSWPSKRGQFNHSIMEWEKPDFQLLSFTHSWGQIDDPNLTFAYFSNGLVQLQPPTRRCEFTAAQQNQNPQTMQRHWRPIALGLASQQCPASPRLQQLGHHPPELGESVKKRRGQKIRLKIVWYNIISVRAFMWAI